MKVKPFGARPSRNVSSGGQSSSFDEYNRHLKGKPYLTAVEYASRDVNEYTRYPEFKDLTAETEDSEEQKRRDEKKKQDLKAKARQRLIQQAVAVVAGSVVITTSYVQAVNARNAEKNAPTTIVADSGESTDNPVVVPGNNASWVWDGENAVLILQNESGETVSETPADVSAAETPAECAKPGETVYTATVEIDGQTYTDVRSEELPALGHSFGEGKEVTLDNGESAYDFECSRCHEHFTVVNSASEED